MSARLSSADAAWLHMDRPTNLMVINSVLLFDQPVDWERVKQVTQLRLVDRYPRFRQHALQLFNQIISGLQGRQIVVQGDHSLSDKRLEMFDQLLEEVAIAVGIRNKYFDRRRRFSGHRFLSCHLGFLF